MSVTDWTFRSKAQHEEHNNEERHSTKSPNKRKGGRRHQKIGWSHCITVTDILEERTSSDAKWISSRVESL